MDTHLRKLYSTWNAAQQRNDWNIGLSRQFEDITNSLISTGPFYYYVIDFSEMSLSHVSQSIYDIHGLDPKTVTFDAILKTIHPDDVDFVSKVEASIPIFLSKTVGLDKLIFYKMNYSFRSLMRDGNYAMLNHQSILLELGQNGHLGKFLNIHTRIDHLTNTNTYRYSMIGLNGEPTFLNINIDESLNNSSNSLSVREIEIIKLLSAGLNNKQIAEKLFISPNTVKTHRHNILTKINCTNTAQLINKSLLAGLI